MKFISGTSIEPVNQDLDTLSVSTTVPVVIPSGQELKLEAERPAMKAFDFERMNDVPKKFQQATSLEPKPSILQPNPSPEISGPKPNIDVYWQFPYVELQLVPGAFYPGVPGDSVSMLTYGNFYGHSARAGAQDEPEDGREVKSPLSVVESLSKRATGDTLTLRKKTAKWVETIVVDKPGIVKPVESAKFVLQQEWFLSIVILSVAITGLLRLKWPKYLAGVFNSVLYPGGTSTLRTEKYGISRSGSIIVGFLFYLNFSLFIFEVLSNNQRTLLGFSGWKLLGAIFLFLLVLFTAKIMVYKFVGWVFDTGQEVRAYLFQSELMSKAFAMVLLPLVVLFPFATEILRQWLFGAGVGVFILLYLIQIGRGVVVNLRDPASIYYIILYLCALEILPLSILYRVFLY